MATLSGTEQHANRRRLANRAGEVRWQKSQINTALQAVENEFEARVRASLRTVIENSGSGVAFSDAEKDFIIETWMRQRDERGRGVESSSFGV